jgi:glycine betaine/choline ABC-type transport system substrate-binding protein
MKAEELFKALGNKDVDLIVTTSTDGHLTSGDYKVLADDQKAFPPMTAGLVVRDDVLAGEPKLQETLNRLSNRISVETMRQLNAQVEIDERKIEDVARDFLNSAGLK